MVSGPGDEETVGAKKHRARRHLYFALHTIVGLGYYCAF
jgi:hypothetical protein